MKGFFYEAITERISQPFNPRRGGISAESAPWWNFS